MREESPVHLQTGLDGETPIWFVTRYDDVVTVLTTANASSSTRSSR